uniref:Uncharacterized protein n=1 Tax=Eutreptiella gymnastica TaxID=73025 RepID=A0A7S4CZ51_9EUGL
MCLPSRNPVACPAQISQQPLLATATHNVRTAHAGGWMQARMAREGLDDYGHLFAHKRQPQRRAPESSSKSTYSDCLGDVGGLNKMSLNALPLEAIDMASMT